MTGAHRERPGRPFLVGLDGLTSPDEEILATDAPAVEARTPLTLVPEAAARIRDEIRRAGGREVCFLASVDAARRVHDPRAVARGNYEAVLVAARDAPEGGVMLHNHPSGVLEPSDADMRVAAQLYEQGLGTAIVDNDAGPSLRRGGAAGPAGSWSRWSWRTLEAVLAPGGRWPAGRPGTRIGPGQREMLRGGRGALQRGRRHARGGGHRNGQVAGLPGPGGPVGARTTGSGPSCRRTRSTSRSSSSAKDLPLVQELVGDVTWALVKGRGNYVSIRRALLAAEGQASLFEDDRSSEVKALLSNGSSTTEDGSLSDLAFTPSDEVWDEVRSDPDICLRAPLPALPALLLPEVPAPGRVGRAPGGEPPPAVHRPGGPARDAELHPRRRAARPTST